MRLDSGTTETDGDRYAYRVFKKDDTLFGRDADQ